MKKIVQIFISFMLPRWQVAIFSVIDWLNSRDSRPLERNESVIRQSEWLKHYCSFNRQHVDANIEKPNGLILTDCFPAPQWVIANSIFLNSLARKHNASIASYGSRPRPAELAEIYESFGASQHLEVKLTSGQYRKCFEMFRKVRADIRSLEELFDLTIDGVWLGLDVYESTLRVGKPTVELSDYHTIKNLYQSLKYFVYFTDLIKSGQIKAVALSHDCYVQMGTVMKVAQRHNIPVYFANPFEISRSFSTHDIYQKFKKYPDYFNSLDEERRDKLIKKAEQSISKRLSGEIGVDMQYQTKTAFEAKSIERQTSNTNNLKIIVATHCFYDNPHAYGRMTFKDFYEWLEFLGGIASITEYEWYIKPHRDYLPGTLEILSDFCVKYPKFKLVSPETSFYQLKKEGVSVALTCYGSIGHELPLLGYQVINCSYNPHIAYSFNLNCKSREEYREILLNLKDLPIENNLEKIYEFYAIHHYVVYSKSFLFESYDDYEKFLEGDLNSIRGYQYFMKSPHENLARYRTLTELYLSSDRQYLFEITNYASLICK